MYIAIFDYLERVFAAVRPRKLLFMAVDGVAPRAKMNQQRSRRFRSAQEAQEKEQAEATLREQWASEGREVPPPSSSRPFDSNVITPGTPFMDRLAVYLRTFIHQKLSSDPGWAGIKVILSDGSVPGEGEHKIMEYIRSQRNQPGYDPNSRHVIHGLDADLIMLSLATHEPHFSILREYVGPASKKPIVDLATQIEAEIMRKAEQEAEGKTSGGLPDDQMGGGAKDAAPTPFQFLHIATLREYLALEFHAPDCDYSCVGGFDLERVIDDFIFLCFFVGNDFLPHLPSLEIRLGAIDTLCDLYKANFGRLGGFICDGGRVDLTRAKLFCTELGGLEDELLRRHRQEEDKFKSKQRRREEEVKKKETGTRHKNMLQRVAEFATVPRAAPHLMNMRPDGKPPNAADADAAELASRTAAYEQVLGRDAAVCHIFDTVKTFAELPDDADSERLPTGLNGYQRAMAHQYCEELGVKTESRGSDPNREMWLIKKGDNANESAATKFKRELDSLVKTAQTHEVEEDAVMLGVPGWKQRYYARKFSDKDATECASIAHSYIEGLCWVMRYYFEGCNSWTWYFPFHYAPFAADIAEAINPEVPIEFEVGVPFQPFEQLMGVLPPRSSHALPSCLAELMVDGESDLLDFYPALNEIRLDLNGKKFTWQAVVLLPFIEEKRLLAAMSNCTQMLTDDEARRNSHGEPVVFISRAHRAYRPLIESCYASPPTNLVLDAQLGALLFGTARPFPHAPPTDVVLEPPEFRGLEADRALKPFTNYAARAIFEAPPKDAVPTRPNLLAEVTMPPPTLTNMDTPVVRHGSFVQARRGGGGYGGGKGGGKGGGYGGPPRGSYSREGSDMFPVDEQRVVGIIEERVSARSQRDFGRADRLRGELRTGFGVEVDDNRRTWWCTRQVGSSSGSSPPTSPPLSPPFSHGGPPYGGPGGPPGGPGGGYGGGPHGGKGYGPPHGGPRPPPGPPPAAGSWVPQGGGTNQYQRLPPSGTFWQNQPRPFFGGGGGGGGFHQPVNVPSHLMPMGQDGGRRPSHEPLRHEPQHYGGGGPGGGGPGGGGPNVAPGGAANSQAANLLRQQLGQPRPPPGAPPPGSGPTGGAGASSGGPGGAAPRPPPPAGAPAASNKSAADLLRQQLKRPRGS